jgi:cytochrome c-type biogenesis protein CcmH
VTRPVAAHAAAAVAVVALSLCWLAAPAAAAAALSPPASLTDIENDVMCVSCNEPLAVAESPQAYAERSFIRGLIAKGQTKSQIERVLVSQYGPAVLGRPPAHGFNLTVYILPPALVIVGVAALAMALPKWRRRARAAASGDGASPTPSRLAPEDARRLAEDLARHL